MACSFLFVAQHNFPHLCPLWHTPAATALLINGKNIVSQFACVCVCEAFEQNSQMPLRPADRPFQPTQSVRAPIFLLSADRGSLAVICTCGLTILVHVFQAGGARVCHRKSFVIQQANSQAKTEVLLSLFRFAAQISITECVDIY